MTIEIDFDSYRIKSRQALIDSCFENALASEIKHIMDKHRKAAEAEMQELFTGVVFRRDSPMSGTTKMVISIPDSKP
jgi:hypothetical protein